MNATEVILNRKCDETLQMMYSMVMIVPFLVCAVDNNDIINVKLKIKYQLLCL